MLIMAWRPVVAIETGSLGRVFCVPLNATEPANRVSSGIVGSNAKHSVTVRSVGVFAL